jgi:hypothetical protein
MEKKTFNSKKKKKTPPSKKLDAANILNRGQFKSPMTTSFPPNMVGFPDRLGVKLKYSQTVTFTGSAAPTSQAFAVNSLFDPDLTGTGHQPSYFDTLAAIYGRYFVKGATAELQITNGSTKAVTWVALYSDQITNTTVESLTEAKNSVSGIVGEAGAMSTRTKSLQYMATSKIMGQPLSEPDDNMYAGVGASPADLWYLIFKVTSVDVTTTITVLVKFTILFDCYFKDLIPLVSS